jgi:hypothetical protein
MTEHDLRLLIGILTNVDAAVRTDSSERHDIVEKLKLRVARDEQIPADQAAVIAVLRRLNNALRQELGEEV